MVWISFGKLQHIYDLHAGDFGLSGNKNPQQLKRLSDAIKSHVVDAGTQMVEGEYCGSDANLYYSAQTQNVVVTDRDDTVIAAFKAGPAQARYIVAKGKLS